MGGAGGFIRVLGRFPSKRAPAMTGYCTDATLCHTIGCLALPLQSATLAYDAWR